MVQGRHRSRRGFSVVELIISLAIVAILVGLLLPLLGHTRSIAHEAVCANNLRQIGLGWHAYFQEHEQFPRHTDEPDWQYGGVKFLGGGELVVLDADRPINPYMAGEAQAESGRVARAFACPADMGIYLKGPRNAPKQSVLNGRTCFEAFGTSYRANPFLLDSTRAGIDDLARPLKVAEVTAQPSRLLLVADPIWYIASGAGGPKQDVLDASWHSEPSGGNMAAFDGSIRFVVFGPGPSDRYELMPRPELADGE